MNAGGRAFEDFWISVIDVLAARGFNRFYMISGHGGNCSFLNNVIKYVGENIVEFSVQPLGYIFPGQTVWLPWKNIDVPNAAAWVMHVSWKHPSYYTSVQNWCIWNAWLMKLIFSRHQTIIWTG
jgi:creatinine amidohydrolase/Fe(II)-dependent formamide hydrolase-like protein